MRRLGLGAPILFILPVISVSAIGLRRGDAVALNSSGHAKARGERVTDENENATKHHLHSTLEEYRNDVQAMKGDLPRRRGKTLPPKCPANVSELSPYMLEEVPPDGVHVVCKYRQPCDRPGTNLERLNSIRGLLKKTKLVLDYLQVPYALAGGSAIGQQRCNDVLPWDSDCDVMVWMHDVYKIKAGDLDSQYAVMHTNYQNHAIPYVLVDKWTGFYCDIFFMQYDTATNQVGMAWPGGAYECPWMDKQYPFSPDDKRCDVFPMANVHPFVPCYLDGVWQTCFANQKAYLEQQYGPHVHQPNVTTNLAAHSSTKATQLLRGRLS